MEYDTYSYFLLLNFCIIFFIIVLLLHKVKYINQDVNTVYKKMAHKSY